MKVTILMPLLIVGVIVSCINKKGSTADVINAEVESLFTQANETLKNGDPEGAIKLLDKAIGIDPQNSKAYCLRGTIRWMQNNPDAKNDALQAVKLNPKNNLAFTLLGQCYLNMGQIKDALRVCNKSIKIDSLDSDTYDLKGRIFMQLEKEDSVLLFFNKAIQIEPTRPIFYNNRGYFYYTQHLYEKALRDYNKAIHLQPQARFHINRGLLYEDKQQLDKALADYLSAIEIEPNNGPAYYLVAVVQLKQGKDNQLVCENLAKAFELGVQEASELSAEYCK